MIKQLAHLCIHSNNLNATENFYCNILGLTKKFNFYKNNELFGFYIDFGNNTFIEVFYDQNVKNQQSIIQHFSIEVTDIDNIIEKLNNNSFDTTDKILGADNSWQIWVNDPNGLKIELHQYTEKSSQLTGNDCEVNW